MIRSNSMNEAQPCPYQQCTVPLQSAPCRERASLEAPGGAFQVFDVCPNSEHRRIVWWCPSCSTPNQLLADFCRRCGAPLEETYERSRDVTCAWVLSATPPATENELDAPEPVAAGDVLITFQGSAFVYLAMASGNELYRFEMSDRVGYFSTPVLIRERVYYMSFGCVWEESLVTGRRKRHALPGFSPFARCRPVRVSVGTSDYLVTAGASGVLLIDVRPGTVRSFPVSVPLNSDDRLRSPAVLPDGRVLFTSEHGRVFLLQIDEPDPSSHALEELPPGPADHTLSAPAYNAATDCVFFECVDNVSLSRSMAVFQADAPEDVKHFLLGDPPEYYEPDAFELAFLMYPPLACGGFGVTWSAQLTAQCRFVSMGGAELVSPDGLEMDWPATATHQGRLYTYKNDRLQRMGCSATNALVSETRIPRDTGGHDEIMVGRPVIALGKTFIQQCHRLIAMEV